MEHPYILSYLNQRMKELGHDQFHFEAVRLKLEDALEPASSVYYNQVANPSPFNRPVQFTAQEFYVLAHNQFYFLVEKTVPADLTIQSDSECLTVEEAINYSNYSFFNYKEFTGQIFLKSAAIIDLEFIKCTPYNDNK